MESTTLTPSLPQTKSSHRKPVIILGAGPAGLTAAYKLSQENVPVLVIEKSNRMGGLSCSFPLWDQIVDLGPHRFFTKDAKIQELWEEATRGEHQQVARQTRIFYKGKFFNYPLQATNALKNLGLWESANCILSYLKVKISPPKEKDNFENWVTTRFGSRLYSIFFKSYSEKLWGIPCTDLHSDFAAQRIKKLSLWEAAKGALGLQKKTHQSLIEEFSFPNGGTGKIYENLAEEIEKKGNQILRNTTVTGVIREGNVVKGIITDKGNFECENLISSIPLTNLATYLFPENSEVKKACSNLKYRNTILVYLQCNTPSNPFPDNWIYVHAKELKVGRITNFNNWGPTLNPQNKPETILCLEYWANEDEPEWKWDNSAWGQLAAKEMEKTGLIPENSIIGTHVIKIPKSYPVYRADYKTHVNVLTSHLKTLSNLQAIGRYGAFKYNNQDHSILMGILAAENLTGKTHNLWDVNTDYEVYQEVADKPKEKIHL
jgi:protoporphyrinogen oxidase